MGRFLLNLIINIYYFYYRLFLFNLLLKIKYIFFIFNDFYINKIIFF